MSVYVDDITFSGESINRLFLTTVKKIILSNGHFAHPEKTKILTIYLQHQPNTSLFRKKN
jgi:hypothetical protein